jgi:hypothetical protein
VDGGVVSRRFTITLASVGNPDHDQYAPISPKVVREVASLRDARIEAARYIDAYALGGGNMPVAAKGIGGFVVKNERGKKVAFITYSGRAIHPTAKPPGATYAWERVDVDASPLGAAEVSFDVLAYIDEVEALSARQRLSPTNLAVLRRYFADARTIPNRVEKTSLAHLRRCMAAGLVEARGAQLVLTDAGVEAVQA